MSIVEEIAKLVAAGDLVVIGSTLSLPIRRALYVRPDIFEFYEGPWNSVPREELAHQLRNEFDRFVEGRLVSFSLAPYKKPRTTFMAVVDRKEDEVFDIRVCRPTPGMRIFGHFALRDVFVAMNFAFRDDLPRWRDEDDDDPEGDAPTRWRDERERTKYWWRKLLPGYDPHRGTTHNDYITNNIPFGNP